MKNQKILWGGGTAPSPDLSPSGEGDTPSPHPIPFGASILAPTARGPRRLRRLVLAPPFGNPGSATGDPYHVIRTQDFFTIAGSIVASYKILCDQHCLGGGLIAVSKMLPVCSFSIKTTRSLDFYFFSGTRVQHAT